MATFPLNDKVGHVAVYAVLGAALAWGRWRSGVAWAHGLLVALGSLYGVSDEWHQSFVPGRDPSVWDWTADSVGVLLGYLVVWELVKRRAVGNRT